MDKKNWKTYIGWILLCELVGIVSAFLTREGMQIYETLVEKPALTPPGWVFGVVWTILFALMGISAAMISLRDGQGSRTALNIFAVQMVVNFFWPLFFFNAMVYGFSFVWLLILWALVVWMILRFYRLDKTAALLQLPYLAWLSFAAYLNFAVVLLNR